MASIDHRKEFSQLYAECHGPFLRYCSVLSFGRMDVEDLVQDVLFSAYRNFGKLNDKEKLLHYLLRAARNRAISLRKRKKRTPAIINEQVRQLAATGVAADVLLDVQLLYQALDKLPEKQREALILFEITGYRFKEIAQLQGRSEAAVKMSVSRGRKQLAKLLGDRESKPELFLKGYLQTASMLFL